ncbi:MAG: hypothetical protein WAL25_10765 [Acidimicrobiia bacterium]
MIFDPPAKSRRRVVGRILVPVLIAIALVLAVVVTASGEETRAELEYLDEIRAQATALSRGGASIAEVMPRIREIDRDEFTTVFESVSADVDVAQAFVSGEPPTDSLIPVWALYRQAVQAWDDGVSGLLAGILQAADHPDDVDAVSVVGDGLAELRAGDNLYEDLQVEFDREEVPEPVAPLTTVSLTPADGGVNRLASSYVAAARSSTNNLGLRPGLSVAQILASPRWQINVEGQPIVPATDTMTFSVVITNVGNVASDPQTLSLTLTDGVEPVDIEAEIPALRPNGQTTIEFEPLPVDPEILYEVEVEIIVNGLDSDTTDNQLRTQFTVNPA